MALFDDDISGSSQFHWGDNSVGFALFKLATRGAQVTGLELADPDHVLRVGWLTFFYRGFDIGATETDYYGAPIWIDFEDFLWHPDPSNVHTQAGLWYARGVRWSLTPGTTGHLLIGP